MRRLLRVWERLPWYGATGIAVFGVAAVAAFSFVFTSDLFNEKCLNERNLLTGEFEASNCGEGAKVARRNPAGTPAPASPTPAPGMTDVPASSGGTPEPSPTPTGEPAPAGGSPTAEPSPSATPDPEGSGVLLVGTFVDGDPGHDGSGTAEIQRLPDGSLNLFLRNFSVTNGPDLFVVLSRDPGGSYSDGDLVLERLKANHGNQNYAIPAGTDLSLYRSVLIWCRAFNVDFAYATLGGVE